MSNYNKIIIWQYGKVGSTSLRCSSSNSMFCYKLMDKYNSKIIQIHSHHIGLDILKKHKNIEWL